MSRLIITTCFSVFVLTNITSTALAHGHRRSDTQPSLLRYGIQGLGVGMAMGLSVGYLATGSSYERDEWRALVLGSGVGALSGIGTGIFLSLADLGADDSDPGYTIIRDMHHGSLLGTAAGAITGALVLLYSDRPKDVLTGAAIGNLAGAGLGLLYAYIEISLSEDRESKKGGHKREHDKTPVTIKVASFSGVDHQLIPGALLSGKF